MMYIRGLKLKKGKINMHRYSRKEIKLRAERRAGEMLKKSDMKKNQHDAGNTVSLAEGGDHKSKLQDVTLKLADIGIQKHESSRWQKIANIPEEKKAGFPRPCL